MSQSTGVLVFGGLLIILAIIAVGIFVVGLMRRTNLRRQTDEIAGKGSIPRDPTVSKTANDVEDSTGNFSRTVADKQDINRNTRT
ncbi:MAG: hypothetical protein NVS4B12_25910 [Ktedonobacteraceae bacterium]